VSAVVVFGAGGHAKVVVDVLRSSGAEVLACAVPSGGAGTIAGAPVIDEDAADRLLDDGAGAFVAIGDNVLRSRIADRLRGGGRQLVNAISPTAYLAEDAVLGTGVLIAPNVAINAATRIGDDVIVNTGATVDHDNVVGAAAHIAPGCHLAGDVHVGRRAFLGVGTAVIPGIRIGDDALVGAGSVVIRDVEAGARAWGNPARPGRREGSEVE